MNDLVIYIIRSDWFYADFEFEVNNLCLTTHIGENRVLKICVGDLKIIFTHGRDKPSKHKIQESQGQVTSHDFIFLFPDSFSKANPMMESKSWNSTFLDSIGIKFEL